MAHRHGDVRVVGVVRALGVDPVIVVAVVPGVDLAVARVGDGTHPGDFGVLDVETPGSVGVAGALLGLEEARVAVGLAHGAGVVEAAHALQRSESVVEGAVLLHEDDDVFGVLKGGAGLGFDGEGALDGFGDDARHGRAACEKSCCFEEVAP